jgi:hypothetical protein
MDLEEDAEIDEQMPTVDLDGHLCRFQEITRSSRVTLESEHMLRVFSHRRFSLSGCRFNAILAI